MKYDGEADEGIGLTTDEPVVGPALQRPQGWQRRGPRAGGITTSTATFQPAPAKKLDGLRAEGKRQLDQRARTGWRMSSGDKYKLTHSAGRAYHVGSRSVTVRFVRFSLFSAAGARGTQ